MKCLWVFAVIVILLSTSNLLYAGNGCGNDCKTQPAGCKNCPAPGSGANPFSAYTGNLQREIIDLELWGGAGEMQLVWTRYYNSRNGWLPWTHAFHYRMTHEGLNTQGQQQLQIMYPGGGATMFTQSVSDPNVWLPPAGVGKRLFQQGNNYFLQGADGYRYRFEKISSVVFGTAYQLQDFRDPFQNLYTLAYDSWHNLLRITEPAGRSFALTYAVIANKMLITSVTTNDGRSVVYNYTVHNDGILDWVLLASVNYGDGTMAQYTYAQSEPGKLMLLVHAVDPRLSGDAVNIRYTYQPNVAEGYIKEERNGVTNEVMVTLKTIAGERWVCYSNGRVQHFKVPVGSFGSTNEYSDGLGRTKKWEYEDAGQGFEKSETDALGRTTFYIKSIFGSNLEVTHPDGSKQKWVKDDLDLPVSYTDELGRVTTYARDAQHRVIKTTYADGTSEQFTYNGFGQVLTHTLRNGGIETNEYNGQGLKTKFTDVLGNITLYTYDAASRLASVTDARGNMTSFEYNERGLRTKMINPDNSFQLYAYDAFGNLTTTTNEMGNSWKNLYDEFKRVISSTDPLNRKTQYSYDLPGGGCGCSSADNMPTKIIVPSGRTTAIEYNAEWQKTKEIVGFGSPEAATTSYEYDLVGNLATMVDPLLKSWIYDYDLRNRNKSITDPLGNKTQWVYDAAGNKVSEQRADNSTTLFQYDHMNRLIKTTDAKGQITTMGYDAEGNMISLADPKNNAYGFVYDLLRRRIKMTYPDGSFEQNGYDAVGNMITYSSRAGKLRSYTYDNRNREINCAWNDGITPAISSTYDAAGRLLTQTSMVSVLSYSYNIANELIGETQNVTGGGMPAQINYTYNSDGLRGGLGYPDGTNMTYDYSARNQLSSINVNGSSLVFYGYDLNGRRMGEFHNNGTGTAYVYDGANRLLSITHQKSGVSFAQFDYGYDNVDRRTYVRRNYDKGDVYAYDATDQVTGVQYEASNPQGVPSGAARAVSYNYDAAGNRVSMVDNGSATNYASNNLNQYTGSGGNALTYNANGSLETFDGWTYTYDAQERLIKAQKAGTIVDFAYDARNRCVKRVVNGTASYLYYDAWNLIEEHAGADVVKYMHGPNVDELVAKQDAATGMVFYHADALGNITQLTNASGNVAEQYAYDVFGGVSVKDGGGNSIGVSALGNRFLFTGREFIAELKLYDYRNRMYSAVIGRFLQVDPIRFLAEDINLYRYVFNNPINNSDPDGLECCTTEEKRFCGVLGGALGGLLGGKVGGVAGRAIGGALGGVIGGRIGGALGAIYGPIGAGAGSLVGAATGRRMGREPGRQVGDAMGKALGALLGYDVCCSQFPCCASR